MRLDLWRLYRSRRRFLSTILPVTIVGCFCEAANFDRRVKQTLKQQTRQKPRALRVGVDTGGTFTDFVLRVDNELRIFKLASTPNDPSRAIREGLTRVASEFGAAPTAIEVVHGTTVGTNALLQRRGARAALV